MARTVGFDGIKSGSYVTFSKGTTAVVRGTNEDHVCKISANGAVSLCADGNMFVGIARVIDPDDGAVSVQTKGVVTIAYTGTAPTVGDYQCLIANATNGVKITADAAGTPNYWIYSVDTSATTVTFDLG
jgi:hypothetical protein